MDLRLFQLPQTVVKHLGELCVQCLRTVRRASAPWQRRGACLRLQTVRTDWAGMVLSGLSLAEIKKPLFSCYDMSCVLRVTSVLMWFRWKSKPVCKSSSEENMWLFFCFFFEITRHSQSGKSGLRRNWVMNLSWTSSCLFTQDVMLQSRQQSWNQKYSYLFGWRKMTWAFLLAV